jgi:uncharacterized membrane protein YfcA
MWTDLLQITFPVAGIETWIFVPPAVSFGISFFTSMAGISGAFLLMPFQVSVLGFVSPSVTATNLLYNVIGTPGGVIQYARQKRVFWALAVSIVTGAVPGVFVGYWLRVTWLPDPRNFKLFVGIVLLMVAWRLVRDVASPSAANASRSNDASGHRSQRTDRSLPVFHRPQVRFNTPAVLVAAVGVGVIGGAYGIGGGAIMAPFLVTVLHLPVHAVAGAVLLANFATSIAGMGFYSLIPMGQGTTAPPDWLLGLLFGVGGMIGMACGARLQGRLHERFIKLILAMVVCTVAVKYILQYC